MTDPSQLSPAELFAIAGIQPPQQQAAPQRAPARQQMAALDGDPYQAIMGAVPGAQISSAYRDPAKQQELVAQWERGGRQGVRPATNSYHTRGQAFDLVPAAGQTMAQLEASLRQSGLPLQELLNEGDHIHVAWNGQQLSPDQTVDYFRSQGAEPMQQAPQEANLTGLSNEDLMAAAGIGGGDVGTRANPIDLSALTNDSVPRLVKGAWVTNPKTGETYQLPSDAYFGNPDSSAERVGRNAYIDRPDMADTAAAFGTAFSEQIPFGDELVAAGAGALSGRGYDAIRQQQELEKQLLNDTQGAARDIGGLAGFGATMFLPGVAAGGNYIARGASGLDKAARAAQVGAAGGALYGAGAAEDGLENRAMGGAVGGLTGFGAGATLQAAAPAIGSLLRRGASGASEAGATVQRGLGITPRDAEITPEATQSAQQYVARLLESSGADLAANPVAARGKPITAAEAIGPSGVANMAALVRRSGRAGNMAGGQIGARSQETSQRVIRDFADLTGMDPAGSADLIQNIADAGRKKAAPLYEAAYAAPVQITPVIQDILSRPAGQAALQRAQRIAANEGREVNIEAPTMQTLDYVKRGLDDVLNSYRDSTTRRLNLDEEGRAVARVVGEFRDELTTMNPAYGEALQAGGDPIRLEEAFRQSDRLFQVGTPKRTFDTAIARMGEADRNALVAGFADKLFRDAQAGRLGTRQLNQVNTPVTREKLATLIGPEGADDFMRRVMDEIDLARSGSRMAPGTNSVTAEATEAMREQDRGVGILNDLARNIQGGGVVGGTLRTGVDAVSAPIAGFIRGASTPAAQPVRDEIARLLLMSPDELAAALNRADLSTQERASLAEALRRASPSTSGQAGAAFAQPDAQRSRQASQR